MSYEPVFAPDAKSQWRDIEPRFQEVVLDLLEQLCAAPPRTNEYVTESAFEDEHGKHVVFVHVTIDHVRRTVSLAGTGVVTRDRSGDDSEKA